MCPMRSGRQQYTGTAEDLAERKFTRTAVRNGVVE